MDNKEPENQKKESGVVESYAKKQVESLMSKMQEKNKQESKKTKFYYSFLTLVLLFCLIQIGFGVILNISKTISYRTKISKLERIKNMSEAKNIDLKQNITRFSSSSSLEGIARNNLKMAGEDEVLILINDPKEQAKAQEEQQRMQEEQQKIRENNIKKQHVKRFIPHRQKEVQKNDTETQSESTKQNNTKDE